MVEWYILSVHTDKEEKVTEILRKKLPTNLYRPFIPQKEKFFRRSGETNIFRSNCFPGYVFIESRTSSAEFLDKAKRLIYSIKEVVSLLSFDGKDEIALTEADISILKRLMNENDCISVSRGVKTNDGLHIVSGALVGMESAIKKIDRHKRIAEIEIKLMGETKLITVSLEVVVDKN